MTEKTEIKPSIKALKIGSVDDSGNTISDILAMGNEYVIYEIETNDINKKLRFLIDGITDDREAKISQNYIRVKDLYIKSKGLLYRVNNYNMMKNRVAHALASALKGHPDEAKSQFDNLIKDIEDEYRNIVWGRILYVTPGYAFLLTLMLQVVALECNSNPFCGQTKQWIYFVFMSLIGCVLSVTINASKMKFESEVVKWMFLIFGFERVIISILAGSIAVIGMKSGLIFSGISFEKGGQNVWQMFLLVIVAAFSENLIPSTLAKVESSALETNKKK